MRRLTVTTRIALCLSILSVGALLLAEVLGLVPDCRSAVLRGRVAFSECLAINCSTLASRGDWKQFHAMLQAVAHRDPELLSIGVRRADGRLVAEVGPHADDWRPLKGGASTDTQIQVPLQAGHEQWGTVELRYTPATPPSLLGIYIHPLIALTAYIGVVNILVFYLFLRKVLKHLDPSKIVPDRVRSALNALVSGLLLMDKDHQIVLANEAFAQAMGERPEDLQGRNASALPWRADTSQETLGEFPWARTIQEKVPLLGVPLMLYPPGEARRVYQVNSSPILDEDGTLHGTLASFDDVTALENKKEELLTMLEALKKSREAIREQNEKLQILATRDPLTGCLNRRSFFEEYHQQWQTLQRAGSALSCIMVDVDYFKSVNDNYGHSMGDEVLRKVGQLLCTYGGKFLVCRFGGEEFCVALPGLDLDAAAEVAEQFRSKIEELVFDNLSITASIGVSARSLGAQDPQELLDQADKCLYVAKRNGRNQVVRWDHVPKDTEIDEAQIGRTRESAGMDATEPEDEAVTIPYHAVTALVSALAYRDLDTANHSIRVAELCQATAQGLLSLGEQYILEIAGMLHDIGKIGVPDSILLKPGPLTDEEWQVMSAHDQVGVEIVAASFGCPQLNEIVRHHHARFGGSLEHPTDPAGEDIPLAARILAVADAYDAMASDRVYRPRRTPEEAFAELRRCAPSQFDPQVVEHFIEVQSIRVHQQSPTPIRTERLAALQVGLQIERLAHAVDRQDLPAIGSLASRLSTTAEKFGLEDLGRTAAELCRMAEDSSDLKELIATAHELLNMATQARRIHVELNPEVLARTPQGKHRYRFGAGGAAKETVAAADSIASTDVV